ncbi:hypothetical protein FG05_35328 [Fusarium graminearum]|nr:hypothetical protein FG05_35328 [Fusarium graminearum]
MAMICVNMYISWTDQYYDTVCKRNRHIRISSGLRTHHQDRPTALGSSLRPSSP